MTDPSLNTVQSSKGNSWLQKSSWKDLVGERGDSSFSISNVVPGIGAVGPALAKASDSAIAISPRVKKRKADSDGERSNYAPLVAQNIPLEKAVEPRPAERSARENGDQEPKRKIPKVVISDVCPFMRSAESEKEWAKAKAALRGFTKKTKTVEKDPSKGLKGMPRRKR